MWFLSFREKPRFEKWVRLEEQKNKIAKAVEESSDDFPNHVLDFLSTALRLHKKYFQYADWMLIIQSFFKSIKLTQHQLSLPILEPYQDKKEDESWTYDNRTWHLYSHMLAKSYGWSLEYISNLTVQEALPKIQEILVEEQNNKEFLWVMSDRSAIYNESTKTYQANPLPRPNWMSRHIDIKKEVRTTKIPKNFLPVGAGLTYEEISKTQTSHIQ